MNRIKLIERSYQEAIFNWYTPVRHRSSSMVSWPRTGILRFTEGGRRWDMHV